MKFKFGGAEMRCKLREESRDPGACPKEHFSRPDLLFSTMKFQQDHHQTISACKCKIETFQLSRNDANNLKTCNKNDMVLF